MNTPIYSLVASTTLTPNVFIKNGSIIERVLLSDIYAITSDGNYCNVLTYHKKFTLRSSLVKMKTRFVEEGFIQINKSTLIQMGAITTVDLTNNSVNMKNNISFSLSRNYRKELINELNLL